MARKRSASRTPRKREAREREQRWREVVAEWSRSGLTQTAFCRERGLSLASFHWWKRELVRRDGGRSPKQQAQGGKSSRTGTRGFLPVRVVGAHECEAAGAQERPRDGQTGLEVVLGNGRRVRVGCEVDGELLAKVVTVLEGLPC
ncbi:MAG: IS66 family insertion sequence element accessory protein TnpA [Planctomycetota bacterium]|jgi:hypothetical protein